MESNHENEIILYQPDDTLTLDERVEDESVWLTQAQMAELFQATKQNISLHIRNIYKEGELLAKNITFYKAIHATHFFASKVASQ